jgi:hypothetical protein
MFHTLDENRLQVDIEERAALEQLRAGNVGVAVGWYHTAGRIHTESDRDWTMRRAVEGWVADIDAVRDAALYAYQRSNVAELNRLAREVMVDSDRVSGPEVHGLAVGDRVISNVPIPDAGMVNSQRATVIVVNEAWQIIDLRADDGRLLRGFRPTSWTESTWVMSPPFTVRRARRSIPACAGRRRRPRVGLRGHV